MIRKINFLFLLIGGFSMVSFQKSKISWKTLEDGLAYASVTLDVKSSHGDSKVDVLKIDPEYFKFEILCAAEKSIPNKNAGEWGKANGMMAIVNAGMFKLDGESRTCTGYLKNYNYINNPSLNPSYRSVAAFNPKDNSVPAAQIIDLKCQDWNTLKNKYNSYSQGLRMIDCGQKNTWQLQSKKWSMVLLGEDKSGNMLFIFVRSPYKVHDYINYLLKLPLGLKRLMYLEGGPEASLYLNHPALKLERCGSYETGFNENDNNKQMLELPNVIGIKRKGK